jgi:hypothetical protein
LNDCQSQNPFDGIVNLTEEATELAAWQVESTFVIWLINDRLDANRLFPCGES